VDLVEGFGAVWAAARTRPEIYQIDPSTNGVATVPLPAPAQHLVAAAGSLWATGGDSHSVYRIEPATSAVGATIPLEGQGLNGLTAQGDRIFVQVEPPVDRLVEIDPSTDQLVGRLDEGHGERGASEFAASEDALWQAACIPDDPTEDPSRPGPCGWQVMRLDPASGQVVTSISVGKWFPEKRLPASGRSTLFVSVESGSAGLWVLNHDLVTGAGGSLDTRGQLLLIDPAAGRVVATAEFEVSSSAGLYVFRMDGHEVWVAPGFGDAVQPVEGSPEG
jgi:hypothetical protein